jgi:hypothetical protein
MSKVYTIQTDLRIVVQTHRDLTTASSVKLRYQNPNGVKNEFNVTVTNALAGTVEYITPIGVPFDVAGIWTFWIAITDNSLVSIGEPFTVKFYTEGT